MNEEKETPESAASGGAVAGDAKPGSGGVDAAAAEKESEETQAFLSSGRGAGARSGALAFLALLFVLAAVVHYYMADMGGGYADRLDSELINHAELAVAAMRDENPVAVVPSWPFRLYDTLRRDMVAYAALAAAAAYVWSLSARARARRDAFLVHEKLSAELAELRRRIEQGK